MINQFGDDIRLTAPRRHKYDSAMAEYLDSSYDYDDATGVEWRGFVRRFGKRLLHTDDQGFVTVERYATEAEAIERWETIDAEYGEWLDANDESDIL